MSAGYVDGGGERIPFIAQTPLGAMQAAMGLALDFYVQGDDARDLVTNTALVAVGLPVADASTVGLRDGEPPPPNVTGALSVGALNESWDAWNPSVNDITTESALWALTFWFKAFPVGTHNLAAKTSNTDGLELFVDINQNINCHLRSSGNPIRTVKLPSLFEIGRWHTVVALIDRSLPSGLSGGQLLLAGVNESTSRAANIVATDLEPANLTNVTTWAWGAQRILVSASMLGLTVAVANGTKVEGRNIRVIAENIAAATWAPAAHGGITP